MNARDAPMSPDCADPANGRSFTGPVSGGAVSGGAVSGGAIGEHASLLRAGAVLLALALALPASARAEQPPAAGPPAAGPPASAPAAPADQAAAPEPPRPPVLAAPLPPPTALAPTAVPQSAVPDPVAAAPVVRESLAPEPAAALPSAAEAPSDDTGQSAAAGAAYVAIRTGNHPGFGRVVFDLPAGTSATLHRTGNYLTVRFSGADPVAGARPPRNAQALTAVPGKAELLLAPGVRVRPAHMGNRLVLDLLDPAGTAGAPPAPLATVPPATARADAARADAAARHRGRSAGTAAGTAAEPAAPAAHPAAPSAKPWAANAPTAASRAAALPTPPPPPASAAPRVASAAPAPGTPAGTRATAAAPPATPPPPSGASASAAPSPAAPPPAAPAPAAPPPAAPSPVAAAPAGPVALAAAPANVGEAMVLPFAASTSAAAFRRGDEAVLVFDERRPIDTAALRNDHVFGAAEIRLLPDATVLRLGLPAGQALHLWRTQEGWAVAAGDEPALHPIRPELDSGTEGLRLRLPAQAPGRSVTVPDPLTGGTLLVGTQREPGQGVAVPHGTPEFTLLPTWQGVAVVAVSDELVLHETATGFLLGSAEPRRGLLLSKAEADLGALDDAIRLTRRFDFPALPLPALLQRLQGAAAGSGSEPAGMRTAPRMATAQAMLALGLGAEAQAVLSVAATSDPRAEDDPDLLGLSAIAALIAGRTDESAALDDPRLTGTDEIALWRGLRAAMLREGAADAAAVLAAEYRLLLAYPAPLQARLLPLAAETMALGGEAEAAQHLVDLRPHDANLDYARALLAEKKGDRRAALAILDRLAQSRDRRERARAAPRAIEMRLAAGDITTAAAADAMDKLLYTWRGDAHEVTLRLRAAELHAQAGAPRAALTTLRETLEAMPEAQESLRAGMQSIFSAALAADAKSPMPPLELVALAEENPDLISEGEAGLALARELADRLAALDLPRRAAPVLEKLVAAAPPGVVRAELGGRLAASRLLLGDPAGALSALGATAADPLPPAVLESRVLAWARATAAQGDAARAAAALESLDTPASIELCSQLLEQAKDWKGADATLRRVVSRSVPPEGPLTEAQAGTLLRLAAAASQAGDQATLTQLRDRDLPRLPQGRTADMLRLLTVTPVQLPEDLTRSRREAVLAGGVVGAAGR